MKIAAGEMLLICLMVLVIGIWSAWQGSSGWTSVLLFPLFVFAFISMFVYFIATAGVIGAIAGVFTEGFKAIGKAVT